MFIKTLPSVEYLRECFAYDAGTGMLTWKKRPREHFSTSRGWKRTNAEYAGKMAGCLHHEGYIIVKLTNLRYPAHRVIWKLATGEEPSWEIDHKDGNRTNNCLANLRAATDAEQQWNTRLRKVNKSGRRGVSWDREHGRWLTTIFVNGTRRFLGRFSCVDQASAVYEVAAREAHGQFYRQPTKETTT